MGNANLIEQDVWQRLQPLLRQRCPRLTAADLADCDRRLDLLSAKIQNRHWIDRVTARRLVLQMLAELRGTAAAN